MKKTLLATVAVVTSMLGFTPAAQANTFVSITVAGVGTISCTTGGPCDPGFLDLNPNQILFLGGSFGGFNIASISVSGNSPGSLTLGTLNDTKNQVQNTNAVPTDLIVEFAQNNYSLPISPNLLSASQSITGASGTTQQLFTGFGDPGNSLVPGVGTSTNTTLCNTAGTSTSCAQDSNVFNFVHGGLFSLSGREVITLNPGSIANFTGTVNVVPQRVPEPASMLLLGAGLIAAARRLRSAKR